MVTRRRSGDVTVEVSFDPHARLHRASPPGAYRARVKSGALVDRLLIGMPARLASTATSRAALDEIAVTALSFTLGDHPDLPVAIGSNGLPEVTVE